MRSFPLLALLILPALLFASCCSVTRATDEGFVAGNCYITVASTNPSTPGLKLGYGSTDSGAKTTEVEISGQNGTFWVTGGAGDFEIVSDENADPSVLNVVSGSGSRSRIEIDSQTISTRYFPSTGGDHESGFSAFYRGLDEQGRHLFIVLVSLDGEALRFEVTAVAE